MLKTIATLETIESLPLARFCKIVTDDRDRAEAERRKSAAWAILNFVYSTAITPRQVCTISRMNRAQCEVIITRATIKGFGLETSWPTLKAFFAAALR